MLSRATARGFAIGVLLCAAMAQADAQGVRLGDLSWPQAERRLAETPIVILPFGAGAKEHGPHLPMNADRVVMDYLLDRALESADVVVAPPILHGCRSCAAAHSASCS